MPVQRESPYICIDDIGVLHQSHRVRRNFHVEAFAESRLCLPVRRQGAVYASGHWSATAGRRNATPRSTCPRNFAQVIIWRLEIA